MSAWEVFGAIAGAIVTVGAWAGGYAWYRRRHAAAYERGNWKLR